MAAITEELSCTDMDVLHDPIGTLFVEFVVFAVQVNNGIFLAPPFFFEVDG